MFICYNTTEEDEDFNMLKPVYVCFTHAVQAVINGEEVQEILHSGPKERQPNCSRCDS